MADAAGGGGLVDLVALQERAHAVLSQPLLAQTADAYRAQFKRLLQWRADVFGFPRLPRNGQPTDAEIVTFLPIPADVLLFYVTHLSKTNNAQSILQILSGLMYFHVQFRVPWPQRRDPWVLRFLYGQRRDLPPNPPGFAQAISAADLGVVWQGIRADEAAQRCVLPSLRLFWCLCVWAFRGLFRMGELSVGKKTYADDAKLLKKVHVSSYHLHGQRSLFVHLPFQKHFDPSVGTDVPLKKRDDFLDPVSAWDTYVSLRTDTFPYAFVDPITGALPTRDWFNALLKLYIPGFTGGSFRAGGATDLAYRGYSLVLIQRLGRWKGETFQRYIRNHPTVLLAQMYFVEDCGADRVIGNADSL